MRIRHSRNGWRVWTYIRLWHIHIHFMPAYYPGSRIPLDIWFD